MEDLTLKRAAMRFGALEALAALSTDTEPPSPAERDDAMRAVLCGRPEMTWAGILSEGGLSEEDATPMLDLIARARRRGVGVVARMCAAAALPGMEGAGVAELPLIPKGDGPSRRSVPDDVAARTAKELAQKLGVTRIAQVGELKAFGLHVATAFRPSEWSASFGSGKSETREGALVGAVMEETEKLCQERFEPKIVAHASFPALRAEGTRAVDPRTLALPFDSAYGSEMEIPWATMRDLVSGEVTLVPQASLSFWREKNDIYFSSRGARKIFNTNGLASGLTLTEAIVHALCELVERHANKLSEQRISNPGGPEGTIPPYAFIDLASCPASTRAILERIHGAGYVARALDVTSDVAVPSVVVRMMRPARVHASEEGHCHGSCTHPDPEVALNRALLEAVQTSVASVAGAREDFGFKPRSLGRHERPRPQSRGDAFWLRPHVTKKPFASIAGHRSASAREDVEFLVRRLTAAGYTQVLWADLSREELAPARVVRTLIPGLEDTNPFFTGIRARAQIVEDLMQEHAW
jgi:ribosomal protein S12 methylthiotransferase accessory factor